MNRRTIGQLVGIMAVLVAVVLTGCQSQGTDVVTIATDATWPPFEYIEEESKEIVGFDIDLMDAIAEAGGFEVEYVNVGFDALLAGIAQGEYDAAISVITITDERSAQMLFSDPYYNAGQVLVVRSDENGIEAISDLAGRTAGAQIGTTGSMAIEGIEGATLKTYDTIDLAFLDLINGQIDAVVVDNPMAAGYVGQYAGQLKAVGDPFTDEWYGIAVSPGGEDLLEKINTGLAAVQGQVPEIEARWFSSN